MRRVHIQPRFIRQQAEEHHQSFPDLLFAAPLGCSSRRAIDGELLVRRDEPRETFFMCCNHRLKPQNRLSRRNLMNDYPIHLRAYDSL